MTDAAFERLAKMPLSFILECGLDHYQSWHVILKKYWKAYSIVEYHQAEGYFKNVPPPVVNFSPGFLGIPICSREISSYASRLARVYTFLESNDVPIVWSTFME